LGPSSALQCQCSNTSGAAIAPTHRSPGETSRDSTDGHALSGPGARLELVNLELTLSNQ
jgi:hypothetical protein